MLCKFHSFLCKPINIRSPKENISTTCFSRVIEKQMEIGRPILRCLEHQNSCSATMSALVSCEQPGSCWCFLGRSLSSQFCKSLSQYQAVRTDTGALDLAEVTPSSRVLLQPHPTPGIPLPFPLPTIRMPPPPPHSHSPLH